MGVKRPGGGTLRHPACDRRSRQKRCATCATKCLENCTYDSENLGVIIATGWGELETTEKLLSGIIEGGDVALSPTQFHNSVHNTAAGYLGIMLKVKGPTLTISQENHSLEAALAAGHLLIDSEQTRNVLVGGVDTLTL